MVTRSLMIVVILLGVGAADPLSAQMSGMGASPSTLTPPVKGFYGGTTVLFIHTEASDPAVAEMLTRMMGPKVLVVPGLARIPRQFLGQVYVFRNGPPGEGPLGHQPDVFDSAPPDPTYTPLRRVVFVEWTRGTQPRVLTSARDITAGESRGQLRLIQTVIVVNMPMLTWPGGHR